MFAALREEGANVSDFALLDGDVRKPQPSDENPQNHIRFIQLSCHEAENLYLSDEVLAMLELDWPTAHAKIVENAGKYGNKARKLRSAPNWDRMTVDIKNVINELTAILDDKNVHWTIRTAHKIGRNRPEGQLANFLGEEVVENLWGELAEPEINNAEQV